MHAELQQLQQQAPADPARLVFVQALLRRAEAQRPAVQQRLIERAAAALADYRQREAVGKPVQQGGRRLPTIHSPRAISALRGVLDGDGSATEATALSAVAAQMRQQELQLLGAVAKAGSAPPLLRELRAARLLRGRQREAAVEQRIARAIASAPQDPGPLNPQMLAIRSLSAMRDFSGEYAKQFVEYLDTLMWLESIGGGEEAKTKKGGRKKARR